MPSLRVSDSICLWSWHPLHGEMDPFLLTVSLLLTEVASNGVIPVEVQTLNIADGGDIEVKFLDGNGGAVGSVKGKVYSGIFRAKYALEKDNATGLMLPIANISDYGLQLAGPAIQVLPPVKIENLKWMEGDTGGRRDAGAARGADRPLHPCGARYHLANFGFRCPRTRPRSAALGLSLLGPNPGQEDRRTPRGRLGRERPQGQARLHHQPVRRHERAFEEGGVCGRTKPLGVNQ